MDTYGKRLEAALISKNPETDNREWFAGKVGISVQAISQVIVGKTKALTSENHEKAVRALGCDGYWLATGEGEMVAPALIPFSLELRSKLKTLNGDQLWKCENTLRMHLDMDVIPIKANLLTA